MNWITTLATTYENCLERIGDRSEEHPLMPLSHTTQKFQIEVTLDHQANFIRASVVENKRQPTLIPATEDSAGRSGIKPLTHPLADKLQYLAGDFLDYGGSVTSGYIGDPQKPHRDYLELLQDWQAKYPHPKAQIILQYIRKNTLIRNLVDHKIIPTTDDASSLFIDQWEDKDTQPLIFSALPNKGKPQDALVRWRVEIPDDPTPETWLDRDHGTVGTNITSALSRTKVSATPQARLFPLPFKVPIISAAPETKPSLSPPTINMASPTVDVLPTKKAVRSSLRDQFRYHAKGP